MDSSVVPGRLPQGTRLPSSLGSSRPEPPSERDERDVGERSVAELEDQRRQLEKALSDLKGAQARLLQAHKLEAIGQLAAGIAHEINTPTQYVTDNVEFLSRAFDRLCNLVLVSRELLESATQGPPSPDVIARALASFAGARVDYILAEAPKALQQSVDGLHRVASIVAAMKDFSHPSAGEKAPCDLNEAIASTITVATNEWKYVAEMETVFDPDLPLVRCLRDEVSQVILNLIVNAAHAIDAVVLGGTNGKGTIKIETAHDESWAEIRVSDTGCGIPEKARDRVFDPFFTTKPVGKGTGQGLAIAYSVIVDKHGGEIFFETELGRGTTFVVRLPVNVHEERLSTFCAPLRPLA
jgi:signal transduction histidine kinase